MLTTAEFIVFNKFNHDFSEVSLVYFNNVRGQGYGTVVDGLGTVTAFMYASLLVKGRYFIFAKDSANINLMG